MDDGCIAEAVKNGDIHSFEYLVKAYENRVYGFIFNMVHNHDTAEDLAQDVFISAYKNLHRYDPNYPIKPWLLKIAYNMTVNHIKRNKREIPLDEEILENAPGKDQIEEFETKSVLLSEIHSLKPDCRAIFILRFMEDLSFDQIAIMLGTSTPSVKLKFYRNRKVLIKKLSRAFKEV